MSAEELCELTCKIFRATGAPDYAARLVADSLVEANLTGHDSHGVIRITEYINKIREGRIDGPTSGLDPARLHSLIELAESALAPEAH